MADTPIKFVRAMFLGMYEGQWFTYIDPEGTDGSFALIENREFMWTESNYGCDCNRGYLIGQKDMKCGDKIKLQEIIPVDEKFVGWGLLLGEVEL